MAVLVQKGHCTVRLFWRVPPTLIIIMGSFVSSQLRWTWLVASCKVASCKLQLGMVYSWVGLGWDPLSGEIFFCHTFDYWFAWVDFLVILFCAVSSVLKSNT
ncbi:hypothetical protein VNO78_21005 [Psophocarpus tetragonolobus]|uniref:Uncharacterized protein n=1 Tax=Psophocarpus tetragonolobus TaxID=3891 RepID=A0AAN9SFS3_PSOTE